MPAQLNPHRFIWLLAVLVIGSLLISACVPGAGLFEPNVTDHEGDPYPYPGPTDDDTTPNHEIEFVGVVNSIGPEVWVIDDHEVLVTPDTEIGPGVELGALVKVHAREQADGSLVAREIELAHDDDHTPEPTRTGTTEPTHEPDHTPEVTRTREATATHEPDISRTPEPSRTHEATRTAEPTRDHTPEPAHTATREPEHTPEPTHTHAPEHTPEPTHTHEPEHTPEPTRTGTTEPTHAPTNTPMPEIEFTGVLTAISDNVWTIGGHSVIVTHETEIRGDPHLGDTVKVHGWPQPDGAVLAREIRKIE